MAKNSVRDFSATAASNTDIQSVNIDESCPASGINNAIRELMADIKDVSTGTVNLETPAADRLDVDNIRIDGNTISSTDTNGNVTIDPNGTGKVVVPAAIEATTSTHANASVFKSTGNTQIMLQDTDASANDKFWGLQVSGGDFNILTCNDDRASGFVTPLTISQAGNVTITGDITANNLAVANTPVVTARKGSNQTISRATFTKITGFTSSEYDSDSAWDGSRFTVPSGKGGRYLISCYMSFYFGSAGGDGEAAMGVIYINGGAKAYFWRMDMNNGGRHMQEANGTGALIYNLNAGDYVEFYGYMRDDSASGSLLVVGDANAGSQIGIMRID